MGSYLPKTAIFDAPATVTPVVGSFSTANTQTPTGLGDSNKITLSYGPGGNTDDNSASVSPDGIITFNEDSDFEITFRVATARNTSGAEAVLLARMMYAEDGNPANAIQKANSGMMGIESDKIHGKLMHHLHITPTVGGILWVEFARDEAGTNDGFVSTRQPTGTLSSWNDTASSSCVIYKAA